MRVIRETEYATRDKFISALNRPIRDREALLLQSTPQPTDPITFESVTFHFSDFSGLNLQDCHFEECTFNAQWPFDSEVHLKDTTFTNSIFFHPVNLMGVRLSNVN